MISTFTNYRLYDALSGSTDNLIFIFPTSIIDSFLHLGQNIGKFFKIVSRLIFVHVLHLHSGQCIHPFSSTQKKSVFCIFISPSSYI